MDSDLFILVVMRVCQVLACGLLLVSIVVLIKATLFVCSPQPPPNEGQLNWFIEMDELDPNRPAASISTGDDGHDAEQPRQRHQSE
jgi:hypothetical protein